MNDNRDGHQNGGCLWALQLNHLTTVSFPNFKYGLLLSTSQPSSNMDIVWWMVTNMTAKKATPPAVHLHLWTSKKFVYQYLSNFIFSLLSSISFSSSHMGFIQWILFIKRWPPKWPPPIRLHFGHSNLVIYNHQISFKFNIMHDFYQPLTKVWIRICLMNIIQDGRQISYLQSVCTYGHSKSVIYCPFSFKFHVCITLSISLNMNTIQDGANCLPPVCLHLWTL